MSQYYKGTGTMLKKNDSPLKKLRDSSEVKVMAMDIDYACVDLSSEQRLEIAKVLANLGYGKIKTGIWEVLEGGYAIACSSCKERMELYWPDGTEVGPSLYYCPYCGAKMTDKISKIN
jgi:hypothetical protein